MGESVRACVCVSPGCGGWRVRDVALNARSPAGPGLIAFHIVYSNAAMLCCVCWCVVWLRMCCCIFSAPAPELGLLPHGRHIMPPSLRRRDGASRLPRVF